MSKTPHTPGPWLQSWDCDAPTGSDASPKYDGFEVVTNDGWPVAFVPIHFVFPPVRREMNKRELDWDEASANLRLISSAPDLLSTLRRIAELGINHNTYSERLMCEMAREAVAQATGGRA